jgi:hypothetical protein
MENSNNVQNTSNVGNEVLADVDNSFKCYVCTNVFFRKNEPCLHYDIDEMDDEGEVSLCDNCADKAMKIAKERNIKGLSRRFFNCC